MSPAVLGMAAHANHFVILFAVPATLLLWRAAEIKTADDVAFQRAALRPGILDEATGGVFWSVRVFFLVWRGLKQGSLFSPILQKDFFASVPGCLHRWR